MTPTVRLARLSDAEEVARLLRGRARHDGEPTEFIADDRVRNDMCRDGGPVQVAVLEGANGLAGMVVWFFAYEAIYAARGSYVSELFVDPERRGRGGGRALLAYAARATRAAGGSYLWIMAHAANDGARGFYRQVADVENDGLVTFAVTRTAFDRLCGS